MPYVIVIGSKNVWWSDMRLKGMFCLRPTLWDQSLSKNQCVTSSTENEHDYGTFIMT